MLTNLVVFSAVGATVAVYIFPDASFGFHPLMNVIYDLARLYTYSLVRHVTFRETFLGFAIRMLYNLLLMYFEVLIHCITFKNGGKMPKNIMLKAQVSSFLKFRRVGIPSYSSYYLKHFEVV